MQAILQRTGLAFLSMNFEVLGPTFVGDTIHVEVEVLEARPTSKSDDRGVVRTRNEIVNQRGDVVITYSPIRLAASSRLRDAES